MRACMLLVLCVVGRHKVARELSSESEPQPQLLCVTDMYV